jgi:hypothetical protein
VRLLADETIDAANVARLRAAHGILLLRLAGLPQADKAAIASQAIRQHGEGMSGLFTVVSPGLLRMRRPLP